MDTSVVRQVIKFINKHNWGQLWWSSLYPRETTRDWQLAGGSTIFHPSNAEWVRCQNHQLSWMENQIYYLTKQPLKPPNKPSWMVFPTVPVMRWLQPITITKWTSKYVETCTSTLPHPHPPSTSSPQQWFIGCISTDSKAHEFVMGFNVDITSVSVRSL